jgi:hypothetical protein
MMSVVTVVTLLNKGSMTTLAAFSLCIYRKIWYVSVDRTHTCRFNPFFTSTIHPTLRVFDLPTCGHDTGGVCVNFGQ